MMKDCKYLTTTSLYAHLLMTITAARRSRRHTPLPRCLRNKPGRKQRPRLCFLNLTGRAASALHGAVHEHAASHAHHLVGQGLRGACQRCQGRKAEQVGQQRVQQQVAGRKGGVGVQVQCAHAAPDKSVKGAGVLRLIELHADNTVRYQLPIASNV